MLITHDLTNQEQRCLMFGRATMHCADESNATIRDPSTTTSPAILRHFPIHMTTNITLTAATAITSNYIIQANLCFSTVSKRLKQQKIPCDMICSYLMCSKPTQSIEKSTRIIKIQVPHSCILKQVNK